MIWGAILLPIACWAFTFGWSGGNFWVKIGASVLLVLGYSLYWQRPKITLRFSSLLLGILSAAVLYFIFFLGNSLAPYFISGARGQVGGIYSLGEGSSKFLVFLLLLLITGPGEEIFWRGFLQDQMMKRIGPMPGILAHYGGLRGSPCFFRQSDIDSGRPNGRGLLGSFVSLEKGPFDPDHVPFLLERVHLRRFSYPLRYSPQRAQRPQRKNHGQ